MNPKPAITVSSRDLERLEAVLATLPFDAAARTQLRSELDRADVLAPEQMPANVVTMNSVVRFRTGAGESFQRALVYPRDARADGEHVSVLAPVGAAMLGLTVGDSIECRVRVARRSKYASPNSCTSRNVPATCIADAAAGRPR